MSTNDSKKVVVIDDDAGILMALEDLLEIKGFDVMTFQHPKEGLSFISNDDSYSCIVCDINMPGLNGIELFKSFKKDRPDYDNFIFYTGHGDFMSQAKELIARHPNLEIISKTDISKLIDSVCRLSGANRVS